MIAAWIRRRAASGRVREVPMGLDPILAEILACPQDKGPLYYVRESDLLYNPRLGRRYLITDGIPVLLINEASDVDPQTAAALDARIASGELSPTFDA